MANLLKRLRYLILISLGPIQRLAQKIGNPEPQLSDKFVREVMLTIQDGDVLLSRENWKLTNPFVPGFWGHAAIFFDGKVIEAVGDFKDEEGKLGNGVRRESLPRWLYQKDSVVLLRPRFATEQEAELAGRLADLKVGTGYDYLFTPSTETFYCSELITFAYQEAMASVGKESPFIIRKQLGVETTTPQDIYDAKDKFEIFAEEINN